MDNTYFAIIHLVGYRSTTCTEHAAIEIAVVHAKHHTTHIFIVIFAFPLAGIGVLFDEGLEYVIWIEN